MTLSALPTHLPQEPRRGLFAAFGLALVVAACGSPMPVAQPAAGGSTAAARPAAASATQATLSEARSWGLRLDVSLDNDGKPKGGSFEFRNLRCAGTYTFTGINGQQEIVLQQKMTSGTCVAGCQLVVKPDWSGYREVCRGQTTGSGVLAGGEGLARVASGPAAVASNDAGTSPVSPNSTAAAGSPGVAAAATAAPDPAGVWTDTATGLSWAKCMARRDGTVPVDACRGEYAELTWPEAMVFARNNRLAGQSDWRLPTPKELATLGSKRSIEWWATIWTPVRTAGEAEVGCRHFGNSGSCGPKRVSYAWRNRVVLVRGGSPDETFAQALADPAVAQRQQQVSGERKDLERLTNELTKGQGVGDQWGLVAHAPTSFTTQPAVDEGTLDSLDWYVHGLRSEEKSRRGLRNEFLGYLQTRRLLDYKAEFSSPFDKDRFEQQLADEKKGFVDRIFDFSAQPLPKRIYTFTPIKLEDYDMGSEVLRVSTCRDLGLYNSGGANGMRCGGAGVSFPDQALETELHRLASMGPMAAAGRVRYVKFASFFNGDNTGAPVYVLSRGLPSAISVKVPKDQARALYDMAKLTAVRPEYRNEFGGKMLSAKIVYDTPRPKGFTASNAVQKTLFVTFTGGAAVGYETPPLAICFYDGSGSTPLLCRPLGAAAATKPAR